MWVRQLFEGNLGPFYLPPFPPHPVSRRSRHRRLSEHRMIFSFQHSNIIVHVFELMCYEKLRMARRNADAQQLVPRDRFDDVVQLNNTEKGWLHSTF